MLSCGFDTCIKVSSSLVNRLISDTLLDAKPHFNQKPLAAFFSTPMSLWLLFATAYESQGR